MVAGPTQIPGNPDRAAFPADRTATFPVSPVAPVTRGPEQTTTNPPQPSTPTETNGTDTVQISEAALNASDPGSAPALLSEADSFTPSTATAPESQQFNVSPETPEAANPQAGTAPGVNAGPPPVGTSATSELSRGGNINVLG